MYGQNIIVGKSQSNNLCLAIEGGKDIDRAEPEAGLEYTPKTQRSRDNS